MKSKFVGDRFISRLNILRVEFRLKGLAARGFRFFFFLHFLFVETIMCYSFYIYTHINYCEL